MIQFKKVILHNFGSYGHAELDLQNRGFCLVSGKNNYLKDNALSNGAGKSFLWSAICYALTGETISGIKTNLKNINTDEQDCFVQLDFLYNKDLFSLVRTLAPKSDLKIYKNDIDLSGKGIRESEKKLRDFIPDLTKDLIASTIIIGQGMPNKFSSFSPSGRKELLEKLTKSDFMIEDLKLRIQNRQQEINLKIREFEDSLLTNKTQLNINLNNLEKIKQSLDTTQWRDFDNELLEYQANINKLQQEIIKNDTEIKLLETKIELVNNRFVEVSEEKSKVSSDELAAYTSSYTKFLNEKNRINLEIANVKKEISKLKSIIDICPTCGQHIPDVQKPDTAALETLLQKLYAELAVAQNNITNCDNQHTEYVKQINDAFNDELITLNKSLMDAKQAIKLYKNNNDTCINTLDNEKLEYSKLLYEKQNLANFIDKQQKELAKLEQEVASFTNIIAIISSAKEDLAQRLGVIKKMDLLIRRDFRGYLLSNVIQYIDSKAKQYCNIVFGTQELSLALNGNALDIIYCGKMFDGLSGGEKQRVDLILQLAIRDLLTSYLGLNANILVLDEVTDFLDKKSCKAVMRLLEKELNTVESVFIISHHAEELEIPVDSEIKVIKNDHGISELY